MNVGQSREKKKKKKKKIGAQKKNPRPIGGSVDAGGRKFCRVNSSVVD